MGNFRYSTVRTLRAFSLLAGACFALSAFAGNVEPKAMWYNGLTQIGGTYQYVQIESPGGLWQEDRILNAKSEMKQVSINELPAALKEKLLKAEIQILDIKQTSIEANQKASPGPRGQAPYHGMLRTYEEHATGSLVIHNIPGIGLMDQDAGEFQGKATLELVMGNHSDPSDAGILSERLAGEMIWGSAAQMRNYATLEGFKAGGVQDDPAAHVMANARLLRGGQEIVAYVEWTQKTGKAERPEIIYRGAIRLARTSH